MQAPIDNLERDGSATKAAPLKGNAPAPSTGRSACDWLVWQLADSAFPIGGFAHSGGLEAIWQHREITSREDLYALMTSALGQLEWAALPFVVASRNQAQEFSEIDQLCDAFTSNHVANRASRAQGQALLSSAVRTFQNQALQALRVFVIGHELPGHYAPIFGAVCRALEIEKRVVARLFVFSQLRGWIGSAVRLGAIGPFEGQALQYRLTDRAEAAAAGGLDLQLSDVAQTAPLLDIFQGTQDRLYSRLFQS